MAIFEEGVCCYMWYSVPVFSAGLVRIVVGMCVPPTPLCLQDRLICCGVMENTLHLKYVPFVVWKKIMRTCILLLTKNDNRKNQADSTMPV